MRILYVHAPGDPRSFGGIQTYAADVVAGMRARGHEVEELAFDPPEVLKRATDWIPRRAYWDPAFLWRRNYYMDFRYHQTVQREVAEAVERFRPEVLHAMHVHQLGALEASSTPSVVSCHGLELNEGELVRRSVHRADTVHCNSRFTSGYLHSMQAGAPETEVLSWGVRPLPMSDPPGAPEYDLITVSRLVPRKNVDTVLRALVDRPGLRYAVVGDGPERELLERTAAELGLEGVVFLGEVDEDEKWRLLSSSRVFVLTPRRDLDSDVEGLGLVYYEAYAAGIPVVAARSGGVPEAVGDGGLLVEEPRDVDELGRALDEILAPDHYDRWREAAAQRAATATWDRFMEGFEALYARTIERRRNRP